MFTSSVVKFVDYWFMAKKAFFHADTAVNADNSVSTWFKCDSGVSIGTHHALFHRHSPNTQQNIMKSHINKNQNYYLCTFLSIFVSIIKHKTTHSLNLTNLAYQLQQCKLTYWPYNAK